MHRLADESGAGLVSSLAGAVVFLAFLLLAVQILVHLFVTSYVDAAASDAARLASGSGDVSPSQAREHGLGVLGAFRSRVSQFEVHVGGDDVTVRVQADSPALLPAAFGRVVGTESIDRTVRLRRERVGCDAC